MINGVFLRLSGDLLSLAGLKNPEDAFLTLLIDLPSSPRQKA